MAKPTLTGKTARLPRRDNGTLNSLDLIPPVSTNIHDFTGLPLDANGWTDFQTMLADPGYATAKVVFVSSSAGNDSDFGEYGIESVSFDANGMFQPVGTIKPFATLAAAYARCRPGQPDIILLKRGDEFTSGFGSLKSGTSITVRHIIASYGSGDRRALSGFTLNSANQSFLIVSGLRSYSNWWLGAGSAINITGAARHQLFEDMRVDKKGKDLIDGDGAMSHIIFRRVFYSHADGHDGFQGISDADMIRLEECVFSEPYYKSYVMAFIRAAVQPSTPAGTPEYVVPVGWDLNVPAGSDQLWSSVGVYSAQTGLYAWDTPQTSTGEFRSPARYGRHIYIYGITNYGDPRHLTNMQTRRNIFYRSGRGGLNARMGGDHVDNLHLLDNGVDLGGTGGSDGTVQVGSVTDCVLLGSNGIGIRSMIGGELSRNIIVPYDGNDGGTTTFGVGNSGTTGGRSQPFFKNYTIEDNISYNGADRFLDLSSSFTELENIVVRNNIAMFPAGSNEIIRHRSWVNDGGNRFTGYTYSGNKYYSVSSTIFLPGTNYSGWVAASGETGSSFELVSFTDPDRDVSTYMTSIGATGAHEEFMAVAVEQSRQNWDARYTANALNNYIRAGFDRAAI